jgi:hypothetical protein
MSRTLVSASWRSTLAIDPLCGNQCRPAGNIVPHARTLNLVKSSARLPILRLEFGTRGPFYETWDMFVPIKLFKSWPVNLAALTVDMTGIYPWEAMKIIA